MPFLKEKTFLFTTTPKTLFFCFFEMFLFHIFHSFSLSFSNIKRFKKNKKCTFLFENPFLTLWQTAKEYFRTPTHYYLCFFRCPQNTIKLGKASKTNLGPSFDPTLDQALTHKNPNLGPSFDSTAHIYIYTYTYCSTPSCGGRFSQWPSWCGMGFGLLLALTYYDLGPSMPSHVPSFLCSSSCGQPLLVEDVALLFW